MARRSRAYSFNNRTKKLFLSGTVVAETNESNVATVSGLLDSNTQSNITSVGTLTGVTATGNIETTSGFFLGNGSQLTGLSSTVKNYVDAINSTLTSNAAVQAGAIADTNTAITTANTAMKGYVDAINSTLTANAAVQAGLIADTNTAITTANTAMKGYVDGEISNLVDSSPGTLNTLNEIATALGNDPNLATTLTNTITSANTAVVGYIDSEITTVGSDITTANTAMKGYVDNLVSTANTAVVGYVDNEITNVESFVNASNTAMKGYVDGEIASVPPGYADSDVADYLPTYSGNVGANYVNANFFTGDGSQLTGLPGGYSNVQTLAYLTTNSYATESYVTQANVGLKGYTDAQLSSKQATITGAATTIDTENLTASRALVSDGSGKVAVSAVTSTEIGYLDGVTSAIQTQLNAKQATITGAATTIDTENLTASRALVSDGSGKVAVSDVTSTELGYLDGVTSAIQTQLNAKASLSGATFTGLISGTTLDLSGTTLRMTDGAPRLEMDSTGNSGQGLKKITCNDGGGNWNFRGGVYYSSEYKYETTGHGGADIVMNFEGVTSAIYLRTFPSGTAGATATPNNTLTLDSSGLTLASGVFSGTATSAQYADLAEKYIADADYSPGTVVVFGGGYEITESTQSHQRSVAGVISSQPAYLMNSDEDGLPVALQGRVPCKVKGPIDKGDLVVASDIPGVAQRLYDNEYKPGCVIGKALNSIEDDEIHSIEVVVGRV